MLARADTDDTMDPRVIAIFNQHLDAVAVRTGRLLATLSVLEWNAGILCAMWVVRSHVWTAILVGGIIAWVPVALAMLRPKQVLTRHVVGASQIVMAGMLVQLTGGRIETHFLIFGLLAFLAFYLDCRVLLTATAVALADQLIRGIFWPQSLYGVTSTTLWRILEHSGWIWFEAAVLARFVSQSRTSIHAGASRQAQLANVNEHIADEVSARTAALSDSERRYRLLFECIPAMMMMVDHETQKCVAVSRETIRKYGYSEEEFLAMNVFDLLVREEVSVANEHLKTVAKGADELTQWKVRKKDGSRMDIEVAVYDLDWGGRLSRLVLVNDVTQRKQAERERDAMEVQLRHAQRLESIGHLAAGVAHEINTPNQYIGNNAQFLKNSFQDLNRLFAAYEHLLAAARTQSQMSEVVDEVATAIEDADLAYLMEEIPKAIDQALDGVQRVSTLVKAMKEFSHPGQKEKILTDLNHCIDNSIAVSGSEWKYVADMETDYDSALPLVPCLTGDFNQVVLNLIVNAAHAVAGANSEGGRGMITIRTRNCPQWVEIQVEDTGTGIPEGVRDHIFDPFFTTKEVGKGTGQGLAIARSVVVDKHGGSIHFETELGKGTTFIVRLPRDGAPLPEHDSIYETHSVC